ncbi:baseplate assembly protein [Pseudomonas alcaligenes]|uniref:Baseplate assembly protein n=1 Tax=Aquipseudomonas alcaligenes TaxID=43263 RepID=A0ABR7S272_AQUAC|nr:phage baseplate assembly protein V [Pseudomonas alcaligenes]MBC9251675.1 baseplate assembly protein [Pseudomonas alcaligenes]
MSEGKFYGKYRGVVLNNVDPMQMARIQVQVPDVLGIGMSSWAMPCVPLAGKQSGTFMVPQIGAGVWVEFEQGNQDFPIWVGGFWGSAAEVPALALAGLPVSPSIVLQTGSQNTLMLSDLPGPTGGILLKSTSGALISINEVGITISNGQGATIMLNGPAVNINQGALTVI